MVRKNTSEGHSEQVCRLLLYARDGDSRFKAKNQGKLRMLTQLGNMLNVNRGNPKNEDKKELVLHVEYVRHISPNPLL